MAIPLLDYRPSTQNQRVAGFEIPSEESPRPYRIENATSDGEFQALVWAAYRQVFSEHETLRSHRQVTLETQLKNRSITVRDFIRGLAKSDVYRKLVVETNSNYRIVELTLKRLLGRAPYSKDEEISWSIKIATHGFDAFIDALINSGEYQENFGENIVPFQRRRYKDRPFNLVTPRYADYWRDRLEDQRYKWGDINNFRAMAREVRVTPMNFVSVNTANIRIPDMTRDAQVTGTPASISPSASFPVR
ncbi:phycobilisome rod-core linker polypeptide [Geitlerinema sp. PCC 7407]|uniref:phycobilisome rod-core linker polypeptide n=1 Tax=Geitlerinema sp. PCC 7407 TaxID=1173025 RepID=UPI00029F8A67|nr:phycobilisome rod-core linker polypeptide [Geitlerinema sp. PCC 7407]AFY67970.1 Phycobilisome linker polypeptide [Geitlerinema sp. PCC 7407]